MSTSYPGDGGDLPSGKVAKMLISYCVLLIAKIVKIFHFVVFKIREFKLPNRLQFCIAPPTF